MIAEITLDKAGRVVLPKPVRDQFGLTEHTAMTLEVRDDGIVLRPKQSAHMVRMGGLMVMSSGETPRFDVVDVIASTRAERHDR